MNKSIYMYGLLVQSPETKQSGKKHVIATGVLPSQVSVAEEKSPVKNAWLPKKEENKVPLLFFFLKHLSSLEFILNP